MILRPTTCRACFALAFGLPLLVYTLTLAPGLTWSHHGADGGDLVTAAYTLGVPHPPGYPTYTILAWLFTRIPVGDGAWRVNLFSAVGTAAAAALIYWMVAHVVSRWTRDQVPEAPDAPAVVAGLGAAWSYAFAPLIWSQAIVAEVYALSGFWTVLILYLALPRQHREDTGTLWALGFTWALGLGVHLTLLFLAPLVVWRTLVSSVEPSAVGRRSSVVVTTGFLTGSLIWLYLPLRAGQGGVTWGQPGTWRGFWWLVSGALYRDYVFALPLSALSGRLSAWVRVWSSGLGLVGLGLTVWGGLGLLGRRRGWVVAFGLSYVILNLYALGYNTTDSVVYLVPGFVILSIWLGAGLAILFNRMREWGELGRIGLRGRWLKSLMLVLALLTPVWSLAQNGMALDLSGDRRAERFGYGAMNEAPPRAVLLTTTDRQTFALWYYQQVEGLRPDVVVVDEGLWGFDWYRAGLRQTHPDLTVGKDEAEVLVALSDERPRCRVRREAQMGWLDCQISGAN